MNEIYRDLPLHLNQTKHHVIQLTGSNRDPIHILMRFDSPYIELKIINNRWLLWTCISLRIVQAGVHLFWQNSKICHLKGIFVPVYRMICSNSKLKVKKEPKLVGIIYQHGRFFKYLHHIHCMMVVSDAKTAWYRITLFLHICLLFLRMQRFSDWNIYWNDDKDQQLPALPATS